MIIAVDFDETVHDPFNVESGYRMGKPMDGAAEALRRLKADGHTVWIFTARAVDKPNVKKAVADWLDYFHIPYHDITNVKLPVFDLIVDDRAVRFTTWGHVMAQLGPFPVRSPWHR